MGRHLIGLSIVQKVKIIELVAKNANKKDLCKKYKCDISTINRILRNAAEIKCLAKDGNLQRKRQRKGVHEKVQAALKHWFDQNREKGAVISSLILLNKAKQFATKLNDEFEPYSSWLWRWRKRHNIKFGRIQGEVNDNDLEGASCYTSSILPNILKGYDAEDIFNADEIGLFFKVLPSSSFFEKGDEPKGNKSQKARLTLLLKAWMTIDLWNQILISLDREIEKKKDRKIILFADNAACHKTTCELRNIKIEFLPPNTTALIQPLDQGIIHAFKCQYRNILVQKQLAAIEREFTVKEYLKSISILDALYYIKRSWWLVTPQTIQNCFQKAGFDVANEADQDEEGETEVTFLDQVPNFTEYVHCDDELQCYGELTEDEIIQQLLDTENECNSNSDVEENHNFAELDNVPSLKEALCALDTIQRFCAFKGVESANMLYSIEKQLLQLSLQTPSQRKVTDYFK
ncbi:PREDICTED: tigger transposable element-derived protein 6-like [Rhagoletis zephyria]|uniref:tigger transposable element-derived protein 6-like n=1 Tax=Rhagoletis zephyria TaxID=28612 RepID=UPI0008113966|nr:PREDICTED: tigger transposable element-derived protein 6-like [Rhagoletis zephyria]